MTRRRNPVAWRAADRRRAGRAWAAAGLAIVAAIGGWPGTARAATTTYNGPWAGGTILPADTVVLANGASVTGNVVANGTLQFAQTGSLTIDRHHTFWHRHARRGQHRHAHALEDHLRHHRHAARHDDEPAAGHARARCRRRK